MARPLVDFLFPAVLLAALTAVFFFLPIDLAVEDWFYSAEKGGWFLKDADPLVIIYKKGLLPGICVVSGAVLVLVIGFFSGGLRKYRKIAVYLLLVMLIAPGLFVNALMKEGWGRPRPRQVEDFGGKEVFERVWEYDGRSYGKSFPSGHAAMGFYFFGLYFLMRREGKKSLWLWLGIPLVLGAMLGFTRMAQGGHFPSDVLWSAGVCYFVAAGLYYAMGLHRGLIFSGGKMSRWAIAGCTVALLGVSVLAVGTPYNEEKRVTVDVGNLQQAVAIKLKLELPRANLRIATGSDFFISAHAEGFGSPGSRLEDRIEETYAPDDRELTLDVRQSQQGFFAAVEQPMTVEIPRGRRVDADLRVEKGVVRLDLAGSDLGGGAFWDLVLGDVELEVVVPDGLAVKIELGDGVDVDVDDQDVDLSWDAGKRRWKRGDAPSVKVRIREMEAGKIVLLRSGRRGD